MNIESKIGVYDYNGVEQEFTFKTGLTAYEKMNFIKYVSDFVVNDKDYFSIVRDLFFDYMIIKNFTNIDLSDIEDSQDVVNAVEEFVTNTQIAEIVKLNMVDGLLDELNKSVDDNIEYRTGVHKSKLPESLSNLIDTINHGIKGIDTATLMEVASNLNDISGNLTVDNIVDAYVKRSASNEKDDNVVNISEKIKDKEND